MPQLEKKDAYRVGIVGSTGAVGEIAINILFERKFPVKELRTFSSARSEGTKQRFGKKEVTTQALKDGCFDGLDLCIFSAGGAVSEVFVPKCAAAGCIAIDNTSAFRMMDDVPLVVPEVNPGDLDAFPDQNVIANPNCSTIQMVVALAPIMSTYGLKRVIVSTYQSTSGAGKHAVEELSAQIQALFHGRPIKGEVFPHQIAFNCLPHIDHFESNGYTREEMKMVNETKKILHQPDLAVSATTVRVPTFAGHSESVYFETDWETSVEAIKDTLEDAPGIKVLDDPEKLEYPQPFLATGTDDVFVGRIRQDLNVPNGFHMWVVADNLRKGAALNAVQIAESLVRSLH